MRFLRICAVIGMLGGALGVTACRTNETPEQQVRDAKLTANVKSKLAADLGPSTVTNISVNVTNDVVTLSGTVHDPAEKAKAITDAQAVPEVRKVNDDLQIASARVQP